MEGNLCWAQGGITIRLKYSSTYLDLIAFFKKDGKVQSKKLTLGLSYNKVEIQDFRGSAEKSTGLGTCLFNIAITFLKSNYPEDCLVRGQTSYIGDTAPNDPLRRFKFWESYDFKFNHAYDGQPKHSTDFELDLASLKPKSLPRNTDHILKMRLCNVTFEDFYEIGLEGSKPEILKQDLNEVSSLLASLREKELNRESLLRDIRISDEINISKRRLKRRILDRLQLTKHKISTENNRLTEIKKRFNTANYLLNEFKSKRLSSSESSYKGESFFLDGMDRVDFYFVTEERTYHQTVNLISALENVFKINNPESYFGSIRN